MMRPESSAGAVRARPAGPAEAARPRPARPGEAARPEGGARREGAARPDEGTRRAGAARPDGGPPTGGATRPDGGPRTGGATRPAGAARPGGSGRPVGHRKPERRERDPVAGEPGAFPGGRERFVAGPRGARHRTFDASPDFGLDYEEDEFAPRHEGVRRAFSTWQGQVYTGGDRAVASSLRRMFDLDPESNRSLTHGFHPYAARMPPSLVRQSVARWAQPGQTVLDPFCGSGTVLVEAMAQGRKAIGVDASPLAVEIAATRTTILSASERTMLVQAAQSISETAQDRARRRQKLPHIEAWARREHEHFHPHVFLELYGLRNLVFEFEGPPAVTRALRLSFSSMLAKFMRRGDAAPRDGQSKRIGRGVPSGFFARRVQELVGQLMDLQAQMPDGTPTARIELGDARELKGVAPESVHAVVSSPPYAGVYDYGNMHASRFAWLGLDPRPLYNKQIGVRAIGLGAAPNPWVSARRAWLGQMARALVPGGSVLLVVGDGVVGDMPEDVQQAIWDEAPAQGLAPLAWASQERPSRDGRVREIFGARSRREHVLLLRRS